MMKSTSLLKNGLCGVLCLLMAMGGLIPDVAAGSPSSATISQAAFTPCFDPIPNPTTAGWTEEGGGTFQPAARLAMTDPGLGANDFKTFRCSNPAMFQRDVVLTPRLVLDQNFVPDGAGNLGVHVTINDGAYQFRVVLFRLGVASVQLKVALPGDTFTSGIPFGGTNADFSMSRRVNGGIVSWVVSAADLNGGAPRELVFNVGDLPQNFDEGLEFGTYNVAASSISNWDTLGLPKKTLSILALPTAPPDAVRFNVSTIAAGNAPVSLVVADLNGDGKVDMAVANRNSFDVSVSLGDGAGGFGPPSSYPEVNGPWSLAAGDLNGNGTQDLVVLNESQSVSILLGDGNGSFVPGTDVLVGYASDIALADFNGDGKQDLAVADSVNDRVRVYPGTGVGGFGAAADYGVGNRPLRLAVADLNADARPDLAVTNVWSDTVSILLNTAGNSFAAAVHYDVGFFPVAVAVGDLDANGTLDLTVGNQYGGSVSVLRGAGNGSFGSATHFQTTALLSVAIGDFNADGRADVAVAGDGEMGILIGDAAGPFASVARIAIGAPSPFNHQFYDSVAADLNGDGLTDIVAAKPNFNSITVMLAVPDVDNAAPVITQPPDITANATMPSGAVVSFALHATDEVGVASIVCTPLSGSVFTIGTSVVQCIASDAAGNTAAASFNVKVKGAAEQIVDLVELAGGTTLPPLTKARLLAALQTALANPRNKPLACTALSVFILLVQSQPPSAISPAKKTQLISAATRIKAVIGCP